MTISLINPLSYLKIIYNLSIITSNNLNLRYYLLMPKSENLLQGIALERGNIYLDDRGYFYEKYNKKFLSKYKISFVQENISKSAKGTIRGLHWQSQPKAQDKLVTCITGKIFDVAVDLRRESDTFGFYCSRTLECDKNDSLWIPHGFAHGFQALTEDCVISYSVTSEYSKNESQTINPYCPTIGISWPIEPSKMSTNDSASKFLNDQINENFFF